MSFATRIRRFDIGGEVWSQIDLCFQSIGNKSVSLDNYRVQHTSLLVLGEVHSLIMTGSS